MLSVSHSFSTLSLKTHYLLSFIAGLVMVFAYAPFSFWPVSLLAISFWLILLNNKRATQAAKIGFFFGLGWFASGISWVHVSIDNFGGVPLIVSLLLMLLLCSYLAFYPALACYFASKFNPNNHFNPWLLPVFWLVSEYLRGVIFTGFPWLSLGYSQIDGPFHVFAPIIGEIGISFILLVSAVALSQLLLKPQRYTLIILAIIALTTWVCSNFIWVTPVNKQVNVALVQGNIKQEMRWQPDQAWPTMLKYLDLTRKNYDAQLIIWPESAIPEVEAIAQDYLDTVNRSATLNKSTIISGIINYDFSTEQFFNSLIVLGDQENPQDNYRYNNTNRYSKYHLLPIGEFIPFQEILRPLAPLFNLPMSSFSRGNYQQKNLHANGLNILPLICFEVVFSDQLRANFSKNTNLLLTVSNDAWFGDSHGPWQHLEISRMRALEFNRPMLRATNNGITAAIDHQGKVIVQAPQFVDTVLRADIALVSGITPYTFWGKWLTYFLAIILFISVQIAAKRATIKSSQ
jgi:apolipoprotein N-acyltransferase